MELGKSGLKDLLRTAARNGWSDKTINDFVDSVWREKWPWPDEVIHGDVTWNSGLSFTGSVAKYRIDNLYYRAPQTAITLDAADATYPRIDLITLNTSRQWQVIKGTAAANPMKPTYNRNTNIAVTFVHLAAGGTEPEYIEDPAIDKYVTGISWNEETGILTLTRSGGLPDLTREITGAGGGADGKSAYEIAVLNGFVGTEVEWLESLVGPEGPTGPQGDDGAPGAPGADGAKPVQVTGLPLVAANWVADGSLKKYVLSHASITATSFVEVIPANASVAIVKAAEILPETDSAAGSVSIWATNTPSGDISVTINIYETA